MEASMEISLNYEASQKTSLVNAHIEAFMPWLSPPMGYK
jgi:hypothetical protein